MSTVIIAIALLVVILIVLIRAPRTPTLRDEERQLRRYFRDRDRAERRGEKFPP